MYPWEQRPDPHLPKSKARSNKTHDQENAEEALMLTRSKIAFGLAAAIITAMAGTAGAQTPSASPSPLAPVRPIPSPTGVWIDHTGRGAVEITDCNDALCGHVVWVKDSKHLNTCRNQVIGNVKATGNNTWDRGWILDPDDDSRYSVELKPIGNDRLRVVGYMGSKLFSETMTWKRAPESLQRCDRKSAGETTPAAVPAAPTLPREAALPSPTATATTPAVTSPPPLPLGARPTPSLPGEESAIPSPQGQAAANETAQVQVIPPAAAPSEPKARHRKGKANNETCKLELPYITLNYPCDDF